MQGKPIPVYGKGDNVRDWLYVFDHVKGLLTVLEKGKLGETYNIGGNNEWSNIDIVKTICNALNELKPNEDIGDYSSLITFVQDRSGHDKRYAIDTTKIKNKLGWKPEKTFATGIRKTVEWYLNNLT